MLASQSGSSVDTIAQHFDLRKAAQHVRPAPRHLASTKAGLRLETVSHPAALDALAAEWDALFATSSRPHQLFQSFAWLRTWAAHYIDRRTRLSIIVARRDGRLVLVWPLVVRRIAGLDVLTTMGEPLTQYADALLADDLGEAELDAALDHVRRLPVDVISLRHVRDDAAIAPLLLRRAGASSNQERAPYVELAGTPDAGAFEMRFSGKVRSSRRRRRRRLEERGPVTFVTHAPSAQAEALVHEAFAFKRDWARRAGILSPSLLDPRFEHCLAAAASAGSGAELRVSELRCGPEIVGIDVSVGGKSHLAGHLLAPRPGLEAFGVGGILAEAAILAALDAGYARVDLLAPADPYKLEWTSHAVGVGDYVVPRSVAGWLYAWLWVRHGRIAVKNLAARLAPRIAKLTSSA